MSAVDGEVTFVLGETDANLVYAALRQHMRRNTWDVNDDEQWSEVVAYKDLVRRLEMYLDGEGKSAADALHNVCGPACPKHTGGKCDATGTY